MPATTYALTLSYRGTHYSGWQRQTNATTIQQRVEDALSAFLGEEVRIQGASRTDAGVHARGQVAHLLLSRSLPPKALLHETNRNLSEDIRVMEVDRRPVGFHARKCATSKEYRYRIIRRSILSPLESPFALQVHGDLDIRAMIDATETFVGEHDFTAFALSGGSHRQPVRTITMATWIETGDELELRVEGDGFLRGMVRSLVGTLLEVGRGKRDRSDMERLLGGRPRSESGPTAAPQGLTLHRVSYPSEWGPIEVGDVLG